MLAFGLAALSLALMIAFHLRQPREKRTTRLWNGSTLVPLAILIGTFPAVAGITNDTVRIAFSIASIIVSVAAVLLLFRARLTRISLP